MDPLRHEIGALLADVAEDHRLAGILADRLREPDAVALIEAAHVKARRRIRWRIRAFIDGLVNRANIWYETARLRADLILAGLI